MSLTDAPDYIKTTQGGSREVFNTTTGPVVNGGSYLSPVVFVSNFAQLSAWLGGPTPGPVQWFIQFYADAAGSIFVPSQTEIVTNLAPGACPLLVGVTAPYMTVQMFNFSGSTVNFDVVVYGNLAPVTIPQAFGGQPFANTNGSVASGATVTVGPNVTIPGQSILSLWSDTQPAQATVKVWNGAAYQVVGGSTNLAGHANNTLLALPPGEVELSVTNTGSGSANVSASLVPF